MKLTLAKKDTPGSLVIHAERVRVFGGRVFYRRRVGAPEDEAPSGENVVVLISNDDPEVVPWVGSLLDRATDGGRGRKRMGGGALPAVVVVLSFLLTALVCAGFLSLPLAEVIGSHPDGADLARTALEMLLMTGACALCWCSGALAERRRLRRSRGWDHYRAPEL